MFLETRSRVTYEQAIRAWITFPTSKITSKALACQPAAAGQREKGQKDSLPFFFFSTVPTGLKSPTTEK